MPETTSPVKGKAISLPKISLVTNHSLNRIQLYTYDENQVGMFLWGKIPASCKDVEELTEKVLHQARVFITPGFIFGSNGARFIRISLCCKDAKLAEALERIKKLS